MAHTPMQVIDTFRSHNECYIHFAHLAEPATLALIQFGWHRTQGGYGYGPMVRDHCLIHFVLKGAGTVLADDREYTVRAGECFAFFPHQIAYYQADAQDPWEYYWLGFEGSWSAALMQEAGFSQTAAARPIREEEALFVALQAGIERCDGTESALFLTSLLWQALDHLCARPAAEEGLRSAVKPRGSLIGNEYVRVIISIIETSYGQRLNVEELAAQMGLNRSYLSALFKRHTGKSIKAYLTDYRLQESILFLQRAQYSVKQAAMESGFTDPMYFSRLFKARMGVSPHQYRATYT